MRTIFRIIAALLCVAATHSTYASWQYMGKFDNNVEIYFDKDIFWSANGLAWSKLKLEKDYGFLVNLITSKKGDLITYAINCENQTFATIESIEYNHKDKEIKRHATTVESAEFDTIKPGSPVHTVSKVVCEKFRASKMTPYLEVLKEAKWIPIIEAEKVSYSILSGSGEIIDEAVVAFILQAKYADKYFTKTGLTYSEIREHVYLDCKNRLQTYDVSEKYDTNGNIVEQELIKKDQISFKPIKEVPGVIKIANVACREILSANENKQRTTRDEGKEKLSTGTTWHIGSGLFLTAAHVVMGGEEIFIVLNGDSIEPAKVLGIDAANDLALLTVPLERAPKTGLPLATKNQKLGVRVYALGFPLLAELGAKLQATSGEISALSGEKSDIRFYQVTAPIQSGSSGGPLLNANGEVVGMVAAKMNLASQEVIQNVNFVVKSDYIIAFLKSLGVTPEAKTFATPIKPEDLIENAGRLVFVVVTRSDK